MQFGYHGNRILDYVYFEGQPEAGTIKFILCPFKIKLGTSEIPLFRTILSGKSISGIILVI